MALLDKNSLASVSVDASTLAPQFSIQVAGQSIDKNIVPFVRSIEFESADGIADLCKIHCDNPESMISNAKIFQPGNELSLFIGYKEPLTHIGRVIIQSQIPDFPQEGIPTLEITGYTKDCELSDNGPAESKDRRFRDYKYSDAIRDIAERYHMATDIDPTPDNPHDWFQKSGLSDYELIQGLANLNGFVFWVDGDEKGIWTLHFKDPKNLNEQDKEYTFTYNDGDNSTLLKFSPELLIKGSLTKISVVVKDRKTGKVIKVDVEELNNASPDIEINGDPTKKVDKQYTTGSDIKLYFGDYAFDVISNKRFTKEEDARYWAQQWFRKQRENFILASGKCIGLETLMARQIHNIKNTSPAYDGKYYFTTVRHLLNDSGYTCDFNARRLVP
jgi:phage protein D